MRMSLLEGLKMRKMRKSHLMKKANLNIVWEPLLSPLPTKSIESSVTEKGSGGPLGGAQNNPSQDYHIAKIELKGLQHVAQTVARDDYHVVKIKLKDLLHDAQMVAENEFQDGHKQLFGFNS